MKIEDLIKFDLRLTQSVSDDESRSNGDIVSSMTVFLNRLLVGYVFPMQRGTDEIIITLFRKWKTINYAEYGQTYPLDFSSDFYSLREGGAAGRVAKYAQRILSTLHNDNKATESEEILKNAALIDQSNPPHQYYSSLGVGSQFLILATAVHSEIVSDVACRVDFASTLGLAVAETNAPRFKPSPIFAGNLMPDFGHTHCSTMTVRAVISRRDAIRIGVQAIDRSITGTHSGLPYYWSPKEITLTPALDQGQLRQSADQSWAWTIHEAGDGTPPILSTIQENQLPSSWGTVLLSYLNKRELRHSTKETFAEISQMLGED